MTKGLSIYTAAIVFAICLMGVAAQAAEGYPEPETVCVSTVSFVRSGFFERYVEEHCIKSVTTEYLEKTKLNGEVVVVKIETTKFSLSF